MINSFFTRVPRQFNGERIIFSTNGTGATGYSHVTEWGPIPHTIQKINLKYTAELNVRTKTITIKRKIGVSLYKLGSGLYKLYKLLRDDTQSTKEKRNTEKLNFLKS